MTNSPRIETSSDANRSFAQLPRFVELTAHLAPDQVPTFIEMRTRQTAGGETVATVVPVTHTPPHDPASALELPASIKKHLGLDDERSWIILDEVNDFFWPGPDLRPVEPGKFAYGVLPPGFFRKMRDLLLKIHAKRKLALVRRSE